MSEVMVVPHWADGFNYFDFFVRECEVGNVGFNVYGWEGKGREWIWDKNG